MLSISHVSKNEVISLTLLQQILKERGFDALLVRSTDRFFNEYVPKSLSIREKITGFDGSVGDAIITQKSAYLFVDGRYTLQAKAQAQGFDVIVADSAMSIESSWLKKMPDIFSAQNVFAYDPQTVDLNLFDKMSAQAQPLGVRLDPAGKNFLDDITKDVIRPAFQETPEIIKVDISISGLSSAQKLEHIARVLKENELDGFLAVKLDDIAWVSNLRSYVFPYQSAVPGIACILPNRIIFGMSYGQDFAHLVCDPEVQIIHENELFHALKTEFAGGKKILGVESCSTSKAHEIALRALDIPVKRIQNPISSLKAIKNEKELLHLRSAFKKADQVVNKTEAFVVDSFEKGKAISEGDVDDHIRNGFKESGTPELSFRPICASGKNGAIIHYGTPDHKQNLEEGSLFLLDTGGYYEGGYATDLTRTFLAGKKSTKAKPWQKEMFTLVLKASIRGLSARLRTNSLGMQLDALVRTPLWQAGLDFAHGTGHGVGINVHEFPPRIGPTSTTPLLPGQVFSIEPGLYFEGLGGVRIENLATIVNDPDDANFMRVLPLTFCPLDERLIEEKMLDDAEQEFLTYYRREWENPASMPNLPPLKRISFSGR